ncbi:MAG: helix-turn-helix domain-containing protein [Candidatus Brocadiaceae bacterium]|nr:helix-turn-helix domain-containing protein [Candidatus Brocadiaceae bacterium]
MIQVLSRALGILEELSARESGSVKELAASSGLKKSTLCNILKTLAQLGYVTRSGRGTYRLGPRLGQIARPQLQKEALARFGREAVLALADATGESAQLVVLRDGERYVLAETRSRHDLIVNTVVLGITAAGSATGRAILAHRGEEEVRDALQRAGGEAEPLGALKAALQEVRENGLSEYHPRGRDVVALGVPVFCGAEAVAALGVYLPSVRFRGKHRADVIESLRRAGKNLSVRLSSEAGGQAA